MMSSRPPLDLVFAEPAGQAGPGEMTEVLLDSIPDPIHVVDGDWRVIYANKAFFRHMAMDRAHVIGASLWDLIPRSRGDRLVETVKRMRATGQSESFTHESIHYRDRQLDVQVFPVFDEVGIMMRDVTRRLIAERALATSEDHLTRALNGAEMGHWRWEAKTDRVFLSERTMAFYGLGPEHQGMERPLMRLAAIHPDDVERVTKAADDSYARQTQYEIEYRVRRDADWRWMRVMAGPHIVDGEVVGMHGLVQDIHDRKLANERLQAEIEERERAQQRQLLLIHELNHRVKNILAMVQAIATQTLSNADTAQDALQALDQRLQALARAHDVLTRESWHGADLNDIIVGAVAPHESRPGLRVRVRGAPVRLEPKAAVTLALVLHELATNAVKYGALSTDDGWVSLEWTTAPAAGGLELDLTWAEHGGPPVKPPQRKGFGARLISASLAAEQGSAQLIYAPEGLCCLMSLLTPLAAPGG
jgi:PAS domain S-box-containing protein